MRGSRRGVRVWVVGGACVGGWWGVGWKGRRGMRCGKGEVRFGKGERKGRGRGRGRGRVR